jgi:hypothetical protein
VRKALLLLLLPTALHAAPDLFIETEVAPTRLYVGAEARVVMRVFRAPGVVPGTLRPPRLGDEGQLSLLTVRNYEAERDGVRYRVFERSNLLVPAKAGRLVVPPAEFESAQFLTELFRDQAKARVVRGPQVAVEVLPAPSAASSPFLPARSFTLSETWSRDVDALSEGMPVTRTLVMVAEGLSAERLPRVEMAASPAVHVHHDQPELYTAYSEAGSTGRRLQRIVLMPVGSGELELPELSVRWWDVDADAERVATLPGRTLVLHPAVAPAAAPAPAAPAVEPQSVLQAFAAVILVLAALSLWGYLRGQAVRDARAKLKAACLRNDAKAARDALREWERAAGARLALDRSALDAALYAGRAWDGKGFWREAQRARSAASARAGARDAFFRLQAR